MNVPTRDASTALSRILTKTDDGREAALVETMAAGTFRREVIDRDIWHALLHRDLINRQECDAAQVHWETWLAAGWVAQGRTGYDPVISSGICGIEDRLGDEEMDAWRLFRKAQVSMPVFARSLVYNAIAYNQWPSEAHMKAFRIGLRRLAKFYGV